MLQMWGHGQGWRFFEAVPPGLQALELNEFRDFPRSELESQMRRLATALGARHAAGDDRQHPDCRRRGDVQEPSKLVQRVQLTIAVGRLAAAFLNGTRKLTVRIDTTRQVGAVATRALESAFIEPSARNAHTHKFHPGICFAPSRS